MRYHAITYQCNMSTATPLNQCIQNPLEPETAGGVRFLWISRALMLHTSILCYKVKRGYFERQGYSSETTDTSELNVEGYNLL